MSKTLIEYADLSINPIRATNKETNNTGHYCEKIGQGCKACYAEAWNLARRFGNSSSGTGLAFTPENRENLIHWFDESKLQSANTKEPKTIFWVTMSDIFGHWVKLEWLDKIIKSIWKNPQHKHLLFTKRFETVLEKLHDLGIQRMPAYVEIVFSVSTTAEAMSLAEELPAIARYFEKAPSLSLEPLFCTVNPGVIEAELSNIYIGGESGKNARVLTDMVLRNTIAASQKTGAAVFVKQLGSNFIYRSRKYSTKHPKGGNIAEWPVEFRIREELK